MAGPGGVAAGAGGAAVGGDLQGDIVQAGGVKNVYPVTPPPALPVPVALRLYLDSLIATHQHLRLQGIRAGSQPLSVQLEKVYVSLTALDRHSAEAVLEEAGERLEPLAGAWTIPLALQRRRRLVIIGDPGCGKTTLLSYLTLTYARAGRDGSGLVQERLGLDENGYLPIHLPLRQLGPQLSADPARDGAQCLLDYLFAHSAGQSIALPHGFFDTALDSGRAVVLLDGMDEVADSQARARVARVIEAFVQRYPDCRYVVTSRTVGYEGVRRIGEQFGLAEVRAFSPAEVRQFVQDWTRVVETTLAQSEAVSIVQQAQQQAEALIHAIESNARVAELAVNPLLLTVVALVHRYRANLPERRSELYEEAVEVLLGHWDDAKGLDTRVELQGVKLDAGDRRSLLEPVAFWMHTRQIREIEVGDLRAQWQPVFEDLTDTPRMAVKAVDAFLRLIHERSGLLVERGAGVYGFAHLTFQEYLTARAVAARADTVPFALRQRADPWWREVILLTAGYLSTQGKSRVSPLVRALMDADPAPDTDPYEHVLLAAECLVDVGPARVEGDLLSEIKRRLKHQAEAPLNPGDRPQILSKVAAMNALSRVESGRVVSSRYWSGGWREPEWVTVPAGEFWMGDESDVHRVHVDAFQMAQVPVTNAQYARFISDTHAAPPGHWRSGEPSPGAADHPVVNVSWYEAQAYCAWLSGKIDRFVRLPTEAEWEKAARGNRDSRRYPWGADWQELHCNSDELGLGATTPAGLFIQGASPYGCRDMVGNVWEWCQSKWAPYPYQGGDGRERIDQNGDARVLRGGSFDSNRWFGRCAFRINFPPDHRFGDFGFRVVVSPGSRS